MKMEDESICRLPLHVISIVLGHLDSMQTLGAAILSHSTFNAAFNESPESIVKSILINQIESLLPYAVLLFDAQSVEYKNDNRVYSFVEELHWIARWSVENALQFGHLEPANALQLSKMHTMIQDLADDFVQDTRPEFVRMFRLGTVRPTSTSEQYRIYRALYRFQLYCTLSFRSYPDDHHPDDELRALRKKWHRGFFKYFSPWANEQLACVHDFLERALSVSFDEMAAHDVIWGKLRIDWLSKGRHNPRKQAFVRCTIIAILSRHDPNLVR
jgi:hypothetical protein